VTTESGLWVPWGFDFREHRRTKRTVTSRAGKRGLLVVDDSGTSVQIETDESLHAVVRPRAIRMFGRLM
jgi:hypothetical protein